jgi:hypothetical protein
MSWSRLIFRDRVTVNADYDEMVSYVRKRLDENYFKGYIDQHQTQLFCYWEFLPRGINSPLPVCQMNFENEKDRDGKIVVRFKIVNALIILFFVISGAIFYGMITSDIHPKYALIVPTVAYLYLTFRYNVDFTGLMSDLTDIENRHVKHLQELR